ncbi:uncharacterized protein LOC126655917 [Mercurialis annua]|uniref:uncharacterized protein LOC126655917 n=1 Tax=Mercurialis annua TaxID=3986 RepID=UPI00215FB644|nr:uncharacterized protein LOC126655917 [Mercurialis annua]
MGENQNIGFRKLSVVESVSSREELAQGTYANSYDLKLKFKEEEKIISKVSHEHYTYFHLLEDCHRVFKIGTDFIDVFSDNGLRITCDNDVDFMFSWYKLECIVPIIVLERYVTIEDGGGPRVSLPGNMISTQKEIVIQKDVITQEEAEFLSLAEGIELAYGVIHGESATRAEEVTQVADVMQAGVTTQTEGVIEEEIITEEELVSMAECVTQAHGVTHAKGIAQAEVTTQTVRGRTTGRGRQIQRSMPNARRCRSLKPPRLNSDDENEPFNEFQFSDSDDNEWMDEDEINETDSDSDSSNSDASNDADFSETTDEDKLSDVGEGDLEKSSSSEDEPESKCTRRKKVRDPLKGLYSIPFTVDKEEEIVFCEGQTFKSIQTFRDILADYSIKGGYIIRKDKNDTKRVTAQCIGADCKWRIHGSLTPDGVTFMVKTLKDDHTCIRAMDNKSAFVTAKWIANKLKDSLYILFHNVIYIL